MKLTERLRDMEQEIESLRGRAWARRSSARGAEVAPLILYPLGRPAADVCRLGSRDAGRARTRHVAPSNAPPVRGVRPRRSDNGSGDLSLSPTTCPRQIVTCCTVIRKTLLDYEPLRATRPVLDVDRSAEGCVQLRGRVRTSAIKEIAELLVLQLPGVRAVRNDLLADPEVVRAVADALAADPELGPACPLVDCRDGVVITDRRRSHPRRRRVGRSSLRGVAAGGLGDRQPSAGPAAPALVRIARTARGRPSPSATTGARASHEQEAVTKREKRLAAREDRKRRAAAAQKTARIRQIVLLAVLAIVLIGFVVAAVMTNGFGIGIACRLAVGQHRARWRARITSPRVARSPTSHARRASGPHYPTWSQTYGFMEPGLPPGIWLHNLEHGAIAILYNCPRAAPTEQQLKDLYPTLPLGRNARGGRARALIMSRTPDMDHKIAAVAWGWMLELDELRRATRSRGSSSRGSTAAPSAGTSPARRRGRRPLSS